jgi:two-component system cell cycle response regulator
MPARILIIEDNPANLELMSYLLHAFGHDTLTACDGQEGLDAAQRESPDLIICDVELPKIDGMEVARSLRSDSALRWIPLVAVTAFAMVGDRDRVLAAGFDGYIPKPIAPEKFIGQVEAFLPVIQRSTPKLSSQPAVKITKPNTRAAILVVDNLPVNIELMRSLLEPSGYYVFSSGNVDDGLEMARQTTVDLIISDVHMLDKDGYVFIQAVRGDPQLRHIPFMFLSSTLGREEDAQRGAAFGADRFIVRPIKPQTLLAEVEALIRDGKDSGTRSDWTMCD